MKVYEVTRIILNKRGRVVLKEKFPVAFENEKEMGKYMKSKWEMAENNESFTAVEIR